MSWRDLFNRDVRDEARPPYRGGDGEAPGHIDPPRNNVLCGHLYGDGTICRAYAGPDHDPLSHFEADEKVSDPAPGLYETISGRPLPRYAELRERYGDPRDLPPLPNPAAHFTVDQTGDVTQHKPIPSADTGRVDFREMLTTDQAWTVKARLEVALGRPYLATKIAEQLHPEIAAKLCDRLEAVLGTAYETARAEISNEVAAVVESRVEQWRKDVDRARRAKEATRERFHH